MSLSLSLSIASGEVGNIGAQFALIGQNIANAGTKDYATETISQASVQSGGMGMGAVNQPAQRDIDTALQASVLAQNGTVTSLQRQQTALQSIDAAQGTVGSGTDLASRLGALKDAFTTLLSDPSSSTQQSAVVSAASQLAGQINGISGAIGSARQTAQDDVVTDVQALNTALSSIGALSDQIVAAKAQGQSTANLENQRDAQLDTLSGLVGIKAITQSNGDLLVVTNGGAVLPTHGTGAALSTSSATLSASTVTSNGGVPAITLGGVDVTSELTGGTLGGAIALRDSTLPTAQANLDEFAYTLASRLSAQGLTLFTDAAGNVPSGGGTPVQSSYLGFAFEIQVNPAVTATPSLVRDGTAAVAGSGTGASTFTPNPSAGPAGFTTLISRVLDYSFGTEAQSGVMQPAPATSGLGAAGTLGAGYAAPSTLAGLASAVVGQESQASSAVTNTLTEAQDVQTSLQTQMSNKSAVNIDAQMSAMIQLQNAYGANARVLTTVQAMYNTLLQSVSP